MKVISIRKICHLAASDTMRWMKRLALSWIRSLASLWTLRKRKSGMSSLVMLSTGGGIPVQQTKLAPDGAEFVEDVSAARWVEDSLSNFGTLRSMLPDGFAAYARVFHPAYMNGDRERPVRWSTVASWTGRTVHPLMQFERVAGLRPDPRVVYPDPPWGAHPLAEHLVAGGQGLVRSNGH